MQLGEASIEDLSLTAAALQALRGRFLPLLEGQVHDCSTIRRVSSEKYACSLED